MGSTVFPAASSGGVTQKVSVFTSTGTFTAPSNCSAVEVFLVGGGGGGGNSFYTSGSSAGGGGGGGQVIPSRKLSVTPGQAYTVTVGAGGSGATSNGVTGSNGNDTSFGSLAVAQGGGGGGSIDSGQNTILQRWYASMGGAGNNSSPTGGGGGGGWAGFAPFPGSTTSFANLSPVPLSITGTAVSYGGQSNNALPGLGYDGFGGGGQSARTGSGSYDWSSASMMGGGISYFNQTGGNATANTGGGGGAGSKTGTNAAQNGGNGGSGYAVVTYWS